MHIFLEFGKFYVLNELFFPTQEFIAFLIHFSDFRTERLNFLILLLN